MSRGRRWGLLHVLGALSFLLLALAGCSGSGEDGSGPGPGTSRLTLQLVNADQTLSPLLRDASPAQTRQTNAALLRVEVTAADISSPIVAECSLPEPTPAQAAQCSVTDTETEITAVVELTVPQGANRQISVIVSDAAGTALFRGDKTVNLTAPTQEVLITLSPPIPLNTVVIGSPASPVAPGDTFTVTVSYNAGETRVVSYHFELTFTPGVITIDPVAGIQGVAPFNSVITNADAFASGTVRFAANIIGFDASTINLATGLFKVAEITFRVAATPTANTSSFALSFPLGSEGEPEGVLVDNTFQAIAGVTFVNGSVDIQ
jgi:hypothetical protein